MRWAVTDDVEYMSNHWDSSALREVALVVREIRITTGFSNGLFCGEEGPSQTRQEQNSSQIRARGTGR